MGVIKRLQEFIRPNKDHLIGPRVVTLNSLLPSRNPTLETNVITNSEFTVVTFLPLFFIGQFKQFLPQYFLLIAILELFPILTPVSAISTWGPLIFIFTLSGVREALDDIARHRRDAEVNRREVTVFKEGVETQVRSDEVHCGDVILLNEDDEIPADCVILATSEKGNRAFITTANLDGESELKPRLAPREIHGMSKGDICRCDAFIRAPAPDAQIYSFNAAMTLTSRGVSREVPLSTDNLLLQATHLRNTGWVVAVVVYAGQYTKVCLNKKPASAKLSTMERVLNNILARVFVGQLVLAVFIGLMGIIWFAVKKGEISYLGVEGIEGAQFIILPLRALLLLSLCIPISLKVTLDLVKMIAVWYIAGDNEMYDHIQQQPPLANSANVAEELGQVEVVLTDKTGTLTQNVMAFERCCVGGVAHGTEMPAGEDPALRDSVARGDTATTEFFLALAVCHDASVHKAKNGNDEDADAVVGRTSSSAHTAHVYRSMSPDEEALLDGAACVGVALVHRDDDEDTLTIHTTAPLDGVAERGAKGAPNSLSAVNLPVVTRIPFTSTRRRMSVLVRRDDGKYRLYMKGSDDVVLDRIAKNHAERLITPFAIATAQPAEQNVAESIEKTEEYAREALRTLWVAYRDVSEAEVETYLGALHQAQMQTVDRKKHLNDAYTILEDVDFGSPGDGNGGDFTLLGVTAVEDLLQDEVPETISALREAGILVVMLTGDKQSTAIQIGYSCNFVDAEKETLMALSGEEAISESPTIALRSALEAAKSSNVSVVADGRVLEVLLAQSPGDLLQLLRVAKAVICCRVTPRQKASIVELVKSAGLRTLAIGDGGNDVAMIQSADVGVGIAGKEGRQALLAGDYAFGQFRFLRRLLLLHGRYSYMRSAVVCAFCIYKSMLIAIQQVLYSFHTGFSGTSLHASFSLTVYNVITTLPALAFAQNRDISIMKALTRPALYKTTQKGEYLTRWTIAGTIGLAFIQAVVIIVATLDGFAARPFNDTGRMEIFGGVSMVAFLLTFLVCVVSFAFAFRTFTAPIVAVMVSHIALLYPFVLVAGELHTMSFYGVLGDIIGSRVFQLIALWTVGTCTIPVLVWIVGSQLFGWSFPDPRLSFMQWWQGLVYIRHGGGQEATPLLGSSSRQYAELPDDATV